MNRKTNVTIATLTAIVSYLADLNQTKEYKKNVSQSKSIQNWEEIKTSRNYVPLTGTPMPDENYGYVKWKKAN